MGIPQTGWYLKWPNIRGHLKKKMTLCNGVNEGEQVFVFNGYIVQAMGINTGPLSVILHLKRKTTKKNLGLPGR